LYEHVDIFQGLTTHHWHGIVGRDRKQCCS